MIIFNSAQLVTDLYRGGKHRDSLPRVQKPMEEVVLRKIPLLRINAKMDLAGQNMQVGKQIRVSDIEVA